MTNVKPLRGVQHSQAEQNPLVAACKRTFISAWKSFSYDHHETIERIREEAAQCAASFLLACLFCLACAISLSITENEYQDELANARDSSAEDVNNQVIQLEKEAVEELWSAASVLQEAEWKAIAQETIRKVNEESAVLQGLDDQEEEEFMDWGYMNSFVYMLTVTTSIGYGHISPRTSAGRALTIVYAILGIPLFLILMADFGKLFTRLLKSLFVFVRKLYRTATCRRVRKTRAVQSVKPPSSSSSCTPSPTPPLAVPESVSTDFEKHNNDVDEDQGQLREREPFLSEERRRGERKDKDDEEDEEKKSHGTCCCSAWMRKVSGWCSSLCRKEIEPPTPESDEEDLTIDDNFNLPVSLALFILLVYIMCGCFIYTMWENWTYFEAFYFIFISMTTIGFGDYVPKHPAFMMMTTVYLVFGLALTAMCINIIQEKLTDTFRHASVKLKESFGYIMAAASQGEEAALPEGKEVEIAEVHGGKKAITDSDTDTVTVKKET